MTPPSDSSRVLVVDDQDEILELLGEYLRARGYEVLTANDGTEALDVVRSGAVDLVLTDMKMPQMGGLQLLAAIRELPHPVATIIMSGFATVDTAIKAMKQGAFDYLLKPFKLRDVYASLVRASERLRLERETSRMRDLLDFYEACHEAEDDAAMDGLLQRLAVLALSETGAASAAVWFEGALAAEAGDGDGLQGFDPASVAAGLQGDGGLAAAPLADGVVAVHGGRERTEADTRRLVTLGRAVDEALRRIGG